MALYFQWDDQVTITECEEELDKQRLQIFGGLVEALVFPMFANIGWGIAGNAAFRAYNSIYCAVRNTKGRLDTLYGEQETFYINGMTAMSSFEVGWKRGAVTDLFWFPFGLINLFGITALNVLGILWVFDWESVDTS